MTFATNDSAIHQLTLPQQLTIMLLNEETDCFRQMAGRDLNGAVIGSVIAELSLQSRIETDLETLFLIDETETGDSALDSAREEIASEPTK